MSRGDAEQARLLRKPSAITTRRNLGARTRRLRPWISTSCCVCGPRFSSRRLNRPARSTGRPSIIGRRRLSGKPPRWSGSEHRVQEQEARIQDLVQRVREVKTAQDRAEAAEARAQATERAEARIKAAELRGRRGSAGRGARRKRPKHGRKKPRQWCGPGVALAHPRHHRQPAFQLSGVESRLRARIARGFQPAAREPILAQRAVNLSLTRLRFVNACRRGP